MELTVIVGSQVPLPLCLAFSGSALLTFCSAYFSVVSGCPEHGGMFNSICGLYILDTCSTLLFVTPRNVFRIANCHPPPGEGNGPLLGPLLCAYPSSTQI